MINFRLGRVQRWVDAERPEMVERAMAEFRKLAPKKEEVEPDFLVTLEGILREGVKKEGISCTVVLDMLKKHK